MGVDLSTTVAVGFAIDEDAWANFRKRADPEGDLVAEEVFYGTDLKKWADDYGFGEAGSQWTGEIKPYIYLLRGAGSHDQYSLPGGIFGLESPTLTDEERAGFNAIAREIGMEEPKVGQFLAVLWH